MTCVMIATPSFERRPSVDYVLSLCGTQELLRKHGIGCHLAIIGHDPHIAEVRNVLARSVLVDRLDVTDLFYIDDDIGWPPEKVVEFVQRSEDVVAGVYPKKNDSGSWPCTLESDDGKPIERNSLYRATLVPAGFLRIKRHVLEKLSQRVQKYQEPNLNGGYVWNFFEARLVDLEMEALRSVDIDMLSHEEAKALLKQAIGLTLGSNLAQYWGEDYWFTTRWREMGGECWIDPDIDFTHAGAKTYTGNLLKAFQGKSV